MKKNIKIFATILALILGLSLPFNVNASEASKYEVSDEKFELSVGETANFVITATKLAGRFDITNQNGMVSLSSDLSSENQNSIEDGISIWLEDNEGEQNQSNIVFHAEKAGQTVIIVSPTDIASIGTAEFTETPEPTEIIVNIKEVEKPNDSSNKVNGANSPKAGENQISENKSTESTFIIILVSAAIGLIVVIICEIKKKKSNKPNKPNKSKK